MWIDGINLIQPWNDSDVKDIIRHHARGVRMPARRTHQEQEFKAIHQFLNAGILPIIVFDGADSRLLYKQILLDYMKEFGANICYEVLNEPLAMHGSPGYFDFDNPTQVVNFMNYWIDFIHSHIGNTSVLSCGIANVFSGVENDLLRLVIEEGHQNILSIHVYTCNSIDAQKYLPVIKKWKGPLWVTEIGTKGDKMAFYRGCLPMVYEYLHPSTMIWFDYHSPGFALIASLLWKEVF
ncbi:MAG TPA: hypothetical protein ENK99_05475 [Campylobacterales bacterium]|nr:hypothetical protein [Campylobacterales bacterium]